MRYNKIFKLTGKISRTSYKRLGFSTEQFIKDYNRNLSISGFGAQKIRRTDGKILLVDDVFTDGVTTGILSQALRDGLSPFDVDIHIATLGVMAKADNLSDEIQASWHH